MTPSDAWDWELTDGAKRQFDALESDARERIVMKLDDVVSNPWRQPEDYLDALSGVPHQKLRVGAFRLGCRLDHAERRLWVLRIRKRGGDAYRGDD